VAGESVAAVIAEPVQGEGGFITPPPEYFKKIKATCEKYGIVLIMDEVQSGMGRTGKLFASEHFDVIPDILLTAKSLAAGLPLSAVIGRAELMDKPHVGGLGGTYGGNPLSCAAALKVLDLLEGGLVDQAARLGEKVRVRFSELQKEFEIIGDVRGLGPMLALELVTDRRTKAPAADQAKALVKYGYEHGLILLSCGNLGNVIRTLMPLSIRAEHLERGLSVLVDGLKAVS